MAEIALIASVVGIAGAGAKLSIALYQIASTIGNAGNEVETIAREFNLFSSALLHLSEAYGLDTAVSDTARRITEDLVSVCDTILEDGKKLLETLKPLTERVESRTKQVILRIRWLFQKSKFATLRKSLESLKGTLTLHVTTLSYTDKRSRNTSETTKYIRFAPPNSGAASNVLTRRFSATFRLNVESCIATVKNDLQGQKNRDILQLMVNHDRDGRRLLMLSTENRTSTSDQENDAASNDDRAPRDGTTLGLDETTGYIQIDETCESSHSGENQLQVARIGSSGDIERGKSDAEDISAVLESYMEIHFLQKRVIRFAQYVLEKPGNAQQSDADKRTTLNPHGHSEKSSHGQDDEGAGSSVLNFPSNEQQGAQIPRQSVIYRDEHNEKYPIPFHSVQTWEVRVPTTRQTLPNPGVDSYLSRECVTSS